MFHSGIMAEDIINNINAETNDSSPVELSYFCNWINTLEQLLYSDVIKEQRFAEFDFKDKIGFGELPINEACEDVPRFEDIKRIYGITADGSKVELEYATAESVFRGVQADNSYYFNGHTIHINGEGYEKLIILWVARPYPKRVMGGKILGSIMLPPEFIEMVYCKLRSEKYRLTNDDALCAKWAEEYNFHLLNFKNFIEARRATP